MTEEENVSEQEILVDSLLEDEEPVYNTTSGIESHKSFTTCEECNGKDGSHLDTCGHDRPLWDDEAEQTAKQEFTRNDTQED